MSSPWPTPPYSFINAESLAALMKSKDRTELDLLVIDVRDSDFFGGHIKGCRNIPLLRMHEQLKDLVGELQSYRRVIFHCALSQQRGPSAALAYSRARQRKMTGYSPSRASSYSSNSSASSSVEDASAVPSSMAMTASPESTPIMELPPQEILVLRGGFTTFVSLYGKDPDLTEDVNVRMWGC